MYLFFQSVGNTGYDIKAFKGAKFMKKNLAKKIVLGLLTGAVLMSCSVAWAGVNKFAAGSVSGDVTAFSAGDAYVAADNAIVIGVNSSEGSSSAEKGAVNSIVIGHNANAGLDYNNSDGKNGVAIGASAYVHGSNNVALGYGSYAGIEEHNVVSVGSGGNLNGDFPETRKIINVTAGVNDNDAVNVGQLKGKADKATTLAGYGITNAYTKDEADATFVKIEDNKIINNGDITFDLGTTNTDNIVKISTTGITVGSTSTHIDGKGVYVGAHNFNDAKAAMNDDGEVKGVNGTFSGNVTAANFVTSSGINIATELGVLGIQVQANSDAIANKAEKSYVDDELAKKADKSALEAEKNAREQADQDLQTQIDNIGGGAIASINQRLDKTNAKINKVGAGAAALASLHPLEYDPDDKLTFSAGMGNYAGENAAALGAFYRPNEKFMVSLGGTMGNGENMVNLGLSIGLDKPNGYAKLSKRELIQEVNAVKAENEAIKADNEAMKAEMAEMKAMLQAILAKK